MSSPIRIIVADDHPLWRQGICAFLGTQPDLDVIAEVDNGVDALQTIRTTPADLVLLDMEMPGMTGVEVMRAVEAERLPVRVLAVSGYNEPEYVQGLMSSGASGYITKEKPPAMLLESIRAVARGEGRWFVHAPAPAAAVSDLSKRELDVLRHLATGSSNRAIADALFVSENTVRTHLGNLYVKLDVTSAREAVAWAWRNGLAETPPT